MKKAFLLTVLLCSINSLIAQKKITTLHLKAGDVAIQGNMEAETITKEFRKGRFGEWTYTVLAFEKPVTNAQQLALKGMGIELLSYLPDNSYQVRMKRMPMFSQLFGAGVRAMINMPGSAKLGRELNTLLLSQQPETMMLLNLQLQPGVKWNEVNETLIGYEVVLTKSDYLNQGLAQVNVPAKNIALVSELPFVSYLNYSHLKTEILNGRERMMFGLTNLTSLEAGGRNLTGTGIAIGIGDDSDPSHVDNNRNLINRNPSHISFNHGRLVTGSVGGAGLINERYKGVVSNSLLIADYFSNVLTKSNTYFTDYNMTVTNNSYYTGLVGCPGNSDYNELSVYVDQQMYSNPFLQHIFAAGNDGLRVCSPYPLSYGTIKSGFQIGKNSLAVGNYSIDSDNLETNSSRGPVHDGRIKPEIIASGSNVVSTSRYNA